MKARIAGGIEVVVEVISTHPNDVNVCEMGCGTLWNIVTDGKSTL